MERKGKTALSFPTLPARLRMITIWLVTFALLITSFENGSSQPSRKQEIPQDPASAAAAGTLFLPYVATNQGTGGGDDDDGGGGPPPPTGTGEEWRMAGANPARTSWSSEEVSGKLNPAWYKPFDAYILPRTQIVAAHGMLYISTAEGLYALNADNGTEQWVYPTQLPLGHSPTIDGDTAYVGGYDRKLHAVNALNGQPLWTFEAGAGFDTNPLVVDGKVFAGNRDGYFYAINASGSEMGKLAWKYKTNGPIHYSAAYQDGVVFFASDDSYAYALNAADGKLVWKSDKLPGAGFHSWWPVVHGDWVIFAGSNNYRSVTDPGSSYLHELEKGDVYPNRDTDPKGTYVGPIGNAPGDWAPGTTTLDASKPNKSGTRGTTAITEYFEQKPWRRTTFVLNRATGKEYTSDFDQDGKPEYAPVLWVGTRGAGNRYPPVVGSDNVLYQSNNYISDPAIADGQVSGWQVGSPYITVVLPNQNAIDEPIAYSAGGNVVYWSRCCDRMAGAFDVTDPEGGSNKDWSYFSYNLPDLVPGYNEKTFVTNPYTTPWGGVYGGRNGVYNWHGDGNAPIPYQGKVYFHGSNAIIALAPQAGQPVKLPAAKQPQAAGAPAPTLTEAQIKERLAVEVQKMLDAGHLRPGYASSGIFDLRGKKDCGDYLVDYWHAPGDTIRTLIAALPHLTPTLQQKTRAYLQSEFDLYPPYQINHIGWKTGAPREAFDLPPEVEADLPDNSAMTNITNYPGWSFAPHQFYALWKYAATFGNAKAIFDASQGKLNKVPANQVLVDFPHVHNAYIAGYLGYLELQKLAGYPEDAQVRSELNRLLALRASNFSTQPPEAFYQNKELVYCRSLNVSTNFMYMTPELAQYLRQNARAKVEAALAEYERLAPLWFVSKAEVGFGEGVLVQFYDYHSIFQAKAQILQQPQADLSRYLDVPAVAVGDLFYIDNLVAALEAGN